MELYSKHLSYPFNQEYLNSSGEIAKQQLKEIFEDYNEFSKKHGTKEVSNNIPKDFKYLTHPPETSNIIKAIVERLDLASNKDWYQFNIILLSYLLGISESIDIKLEGPHLPVNFIGLRFTDGIHIVGSKKGGKLFYLDNEIRFANKEMAEFGIRWFPISNLNWKPDSFTYPIVLSKVLEESSSSNSFRICEDVESFFSQIDRALRYLEKNNNKYFLWIASVLKEVVPIKKVDKDVIISTSQPDRPGYIAINNNASTIETLVMLTHECSHLYFHLYNLEYSFVSDDAPEAFSILKNTNRPLIRVLLGFHAFANVTLMLKELLENDRENIEIINHLDASVELITDLDEQLNNFKEYLLKDSGYIMYTRLRSKLVENNFLC